MPITPPLGHDTIHVWLAAAEHPPWGERRLEALLSPDERLRAARMSGEDTRAGYITARSTLRLLLARYLLAEGGASGQRIDEITTRAATLRFDYSARGKPSLVEAPEIQFSLAHSGGQLIYAIGRGRAVGVDLEHISADLNDLPFRSFTPNEQQRLNILSPERRAALFYRYWVRKEALLNATGEGLTRPLDSFEVGPTPEGAGGLLAVRRGDGTREPWMVADLDLLPGYAAAAAAAGEGWRVSIYELP
jgi:4'-phosphopantetheinyl transferase